MLNDFGRAPPEPGGTENSTVIERIEAFLLPLGFRLERRPVLTSFLPGIRIVGMTLEIDPERLSPGDILHEAGHLAVLPTIFRQHVLNDADSAAPHISAYIETHAFFI